MSETATYKLQIDWDRDGYFNDGVSTSDPLNLIPSPVLLHGLYAYPSEAAASFTIERLDTPWGTRVWQVNTGGSATAGIRIGQAESDPALMVIPVLPSTRYTISVWVRVISMVSNTDLRLRLIDPANGSTVNTTDFTGTFNWQQVTLTTFTDPTQTFARIHLLKRTNTDTVVFQAAGLMLVRGSSAPAVFNAGHVSNPYDDIWSYCEGLSFSYGSLQYTEAVAPPSSMTVQVNNMDGGFSPENPPSERSTGDVQNTQAPAIPEIAVIGLELEGTDGRWLRPGFFSRGMLGRLQATYRGVTQTLYQGILQSVRPTVGAMGERRAVLTFTDPMAQLNTAQYDPRLLEDVTTGEALEAMFDTGVLVYPYPGEFWHLGLAGATELGKTTVLFENRLTDFETGETTLAFAGDTSGAGNMTSALEYIRELVYAELGGRFFYDARVGQFRFFQRTRDILYLPDIEAPGVFELDEPPEYVWGDDVTNKVTITYYPRVVGDSGSILYTLGNAPLTLTAGQTRKMTVRYQNADAGVANIAGRDMLVPVPILDYSANDTADGSGSDVTTNLTVNADFHALSADLTLVNSTGASMYIQFFQLRGTPLVSYQAVQVKALDGASIVEQGELARTIDLPALGDADLAQSYANYLVQRYKSPVGRIRAATVLANRDVATLETVLGMQIGDHLLLYDTFLNNQLAKYVVAGMTHTITPIREHRLRLTVEPLDRYLYWILGDTTLSVLGSTTRLSF